MGVTMEATFDEEGQQIFFEMLDMAVGPVGMEVLVKDVTGKVIDAIQEGFDFEGSPSLLDNGEPWARLAWFTVQEREHLGFPGRNPINVRTGEMMEDLTTDPDVRMSGAGEYSASIPGKTGPTTEIKIATAQLGDELNKVPKRPVLPTLNDAEQFVLLTTAERSMQDTLDDLFGASR